MSNCCANSASVFSPRTAAKATFALKAGVWFRRGRFVMVSPVRHTSWPLSGRNSTYPAVQISKASSLDPAPPLTQQPSAAEITAPMPLQKARRLGTHHAFLDADQYGLGVGERQRLQ